MTRYFRKISSRQGAFQKGETLVETMLAAVVLAIGMMALLLSLFSSQKMVSTSQEYSQALEIARGALERLRAEEDFGRLYQNYRVFDDSGVNHRFYILSDQSIDWSRPSKVPSGAIGYGYFSFVVNEHKYSSAIWGTDTAFRTDGRIFPGKFDLDGDGDVEDKDIILGRTSETPVDQIDGYYVTLPVRVIVCIYSSSSQGYVQAETKGLLFKNDR